ncbi:tRNA uridine-5-carboxymethylaminomethyl(34) synthesis enzyme MnmG [Parasphaerochaeta coccoides]|uniref:tRNA uridine 5-carboxymethylaminomethyl modification enzyme MnmG n=1 Tax=Parasphaerochaeta coccoides (strain ATCC BAA-1237 / DSM 17374 / SPN1) TaxID=760011 RepID=F4GM65_PARC1|nr:tRNA uridine-5-carboxymethylaminomethyl(34) synthesis enzyme MnmG [Parasphaerochaeta coccoides]AEC02540.1 tRNA uridine 5-carboxymethylaminomethyl modification enzyme mnmG [Parasphaerochaeta coccoides DSM 17374]
MDYEAIVVGGGHAGIEASLALARMGHRTLLVTQSLDTIGRMSCNPAIGGLAKGNLVREVDALGGQMGLLIDATTIQFRILNRRRGPAVQAPRAQADKFSYSRLAKETLEVQKGLSLFMDTVTDLIVSEDGRRVEGVVTERGHRIGARTVVVTTGTFMDGRIFIGDYDASSGRLGEPAAMGLGSSLRRLGFDVGRLKTGTPARVRRSSLDFSRLEVQPGDGAMQPFSFMTGKIHRPQMDCYITWTTDVTHQIIRDNIGRSPLYGGKISGKGPRYCPSIEDKVVRFPERERHQIFVEPEGEGTEEMYLNGLSSSLPEDVQTAFIHTLPGLERAEVMRPGYAVEYDYLNPIQLLPSLETKKLEGLFLAGQTNGTSGYEEAAAQGLMAGINAALVLSGEKPLILSRSDAYIGVLIDDLVTKGTQEPYRMFTSRAEYRLNLRHDDADQRLTPLSHAHGLATGERMERLKEKARAIAEVKAILTASRKGSQSATEILKRPEVSIADILADVPSLSTYDEAVLQQVELDVKYEGYILRQEREVERFARLENILIPDGFNYDKVDGISNESREKFKQILPRSLGQAGRISGVRSSDIAILMVHISQEKQERQVNGAVPSMGEALEETLESGDEDGNGL